MVYAPERPTAAPSRARSPDAAPGWCFYARCLIAHPDRLERDGLRAPGDGQGAWRKALPRSATAGGSVWPLGAPVRSGR